MWKIFAAHIIATSLYRAFHWHKKKKETKTRIQSQAFLELMEIFEIIHEYYFRSGYRSGRLYLNACDLSRAVVECRIKKRKECKKIYILVCTMFKSQHVMHTRRTRKKTANKNKQNGGCIINCQRFEHCQKSKR
jgi:hypothetical protein